jgi:hypothetical protein
LKESPRRKLLDSHAEALTGCISALRRDGVGMRVYLNAGSVIAAHAADDDESLVRRLTSRGVLRPAQVVALREQAGEEPLVDMLFDFVDEDILSEMLFDRFRENIAQFISGRGPIRFEAMEAVFVPNLQLGHDTGKLLSSLGDIVDRTTDLLSPEHIGRKLHPAGPARQPAEETLVELFAAPLTVEELLQDSPYESFETLDLLVDMLADGVLEFLAEKAGSPDLVDPVALDNQGFTAGPDKSVSDDELSMFADYDYVRGRDGDGHFVKTQAELDADRVDLRDILHPDVDTPDQDSGPIELGAGEDVDESDGTVRKISMNFTGPRLTNEEATRKLSVANQVMSELARVFDQSRGRGFGQSQVQLLLDGCPSEFSVLFHQVEADTSGQISTNGVLSNLRRRPAAEHRSLLNKGLADLINRALSAAVEGLDEEHVDVLLENIAGYHQRLGL